jgi:hypothetical protein
MTPESCFFTPKCRWWAPWWAPSLGPPFWTSFWSFFPIFYVKNCSDEPRDEPPLGAPFWTSFWSFFPIFYTKTACDEPLMSLWWACDEPRVGPELPLILRAPMEIDAIFNNSQPLKSFYMILHIFWNIHVFILFFNFLYYCWWQNNDFGTSQNGPFRAHRRLTRSVLLHS